LIPGPGGDIAFVTADHIRRIYDWPPFHFLPSEYLFSFSLIHYFTASRLALSVAPVYINGGEKTEDQLGFLFFLSFRWLDNSLWLFFCPVSLLPLSVLKVFSFLFFSFLALQEFRNGFAVMNSTFLLHVSFAAVLFP